MALPLIEIEAVRPSSKIGCEKVFVSSSRLNPVFNADCKTDLISVKVAS